MAVEAQYPSNIIHLQTQSQSQSQPFLLVVDHPSPTNNNNHILFNDLPGLYFFFISSISIHLRYFFL